MQIQLSPTPGDDTAAAIAAAIARYLEPDSATDRIVASPGSAWRAAGMLEAQGLPPSRGATPLKWSAAERAERAAHWSTGLVGM